MLLLCSAVPPLSIPRSAFAPPHNYESVTVGSPWAIENTRAGLLVFIIGLLSGGDLATVFCQQPQCLELAKLALTTHSHLRANGPPLAPRRGAAPSAQPAELIAQWRSTLLANCKLQRAFALKSTDLRFCATALRVPSKTNDPPTPPSPCSCSHWKTPPANPLPRFGGTWCFLHAGKHQMKIVTNQNSTQRRTLSLCCGFGNLIHMTLVFLSCLLPLSSTAHNVGSSHELILYARTLTHQFFPSFTKPGPPSFLIIPGVNYLALTNIVLRTQCNKNRTARGASSGITRSPVDVTSIVNGPTPCSQWPYHCEKLSRLLIVASSL